MPGPGAGTGRAAARIGPPRRRALEGDGMGQGRVYTLTALAMLAFAANSMLCRMALKPGLLDPASCISLRLASGALMLWLLLRIRAPGGGAAFRRGGVWTSALAFFVYAAAFTFAYVSLPRSE